MRIKSFKNHNPNNFSIFSHPNQMFSLKILSCALFLITNAANASVLSRYQFTAIDNINSQVDTNSISVSTSQPLTYSSTLVPGNSVFVQTDQGIQKIKLLTSAVKIPGTIAINTGTIIAWSEWLDTFTISGGAIGTKGNAIYQVLIEGNTSKSTNSVNPKATINLGVGGSDVSFAGANALTYERIYSEEQQADSVSWNANSFSNGILTRNFEFTYGIPFVISSVFGATAQSGGIVNYASTIRAGFKLADNQTLVSDSGANYPELSQVPLPSAYLLFCSSSIMLFLRSSTRNRNKLGSVQTPKNFNPV